MEHVDRDPDGRALIAQLKHIDLESLIQVVNIYGPNKKLVKIFFPPFIQKVIFLFPLSCVAILT
jgi:hypothetical protein